MTARAPARPGGDAKVPGGSGAPIEATHDALFGGRVVLHQPTRGYRTNVDALLLAAFAARTPTVPPAREPASTRRARIAVDLGAGCGAVALALLHFDAAAKVVLVEIDPDTADMARRNLEANHWSDRSEVLCVDATKLPPSLEADLVVCNPPYVPEGHGRPPHDPRRARARSGDLDTFVRAARRAGGRRARVCFVYPAHDTASVFALLRGAGLEPKRLRMVHATVSSPARVVLVEARPGKPGGLEIQPPLIERDGRGYSDELRVLLGREDGAG